MADDGGDVTHQDNGDAHERWQSFLTGVPPAWLPMATAFGEASGVVEGELDADGSWSVDVMFALSDVKRLLQAAPVAFTPVAAHQNWWIDAHLEDEGGVAVAKDARAVVVWNDNFASGLNATLHVFASQERFEDKVAELKAEASDDDEDDGGADVDVEQSF